MDSGRRSLPKRALVQLALGLVAAAVTTPVGAMGRWEAARPLAVYHQTGAPISVVWEAYTGGDGVRFRVYRVAACGTQQLVWEGDALPGHHRYRVNSLPAWLPAQYYQLRCSADDRPEVVLATVELVSNQIEGDRSPTPPSPPQGLVLVELPDWAIGRTRHSGIGPGLSFDGPCLKPPVPPPRAAAHRLFPG